MLGFGALCEFALCDLGTGAAPPAAGATYGGVWMYGLQAYRRLRGEEEQEPAPEIVKAVARVVERIPEAEPDDVEARLLLRLELEREQRSTWNQIYLDVLAAYRAGVAEEIANIRENERLRLDAIAVQHERMAAHARMLKRRLALILLLDA